MAKGTLVGFASVIVAKVFNPSIFREQWFIKKNLLPENALKPGFLFSDQAARIPTEKFALLVVPQQLQFAPERREVAAEVATSFLKPLVEQLPETPFVAAGINLVWHIDPAPAEITGFTRKLFRSEAHPLADDFDTADARFGTYMSKDLGVCRLKLDMKPITSVSPDGQKSLVQCTFNFHRDVTSAAEIVEHLGNWASYDALSEQLTNKLIAGYA